jgi:hypothetical protein
MAESHDGRYRVIDAGRPLVQVQEQIDGIMAAFLQARDATP